ncbi:hypothetical protein ANAPC1_01222 [Anaplasma phagocytophilum]|uniref:Uncharacterized protein n=1 Tax=Anaplasma phagocytophilum TaxID=948 RepID=A0AA45UUR2_ANAPH|nr:hypothetical protein ANAPC1_01222 [Anaplasma phagocytophilum]SBO30361.1 hypothetical protein ANAPC3_00180 [Anaplasma phagocytophilum]SBO33137.1 hypothetical protein ANAPC2_01265 [Anaplasma phagocytophilum]SBO33690.1 hypothetical protein ANAPC4_01253 [Anaplasma phagocytophilum]SCV62566.1 hypothetical protein ANAPH1_00238 [Anaplasma phagocytophilum]
MEGLSPILPAGKLSFPTCIVPPKKVPVAKTNLVVFINSPFDSNTEEI